MSSATSTETPTSDNDQEVIQAPPHPLQGKYLTISLGDEHYGIRVKKVREIIRLQDITTVPQMPPHLKGVTNLRGKIIPVIDLRLKFNIYPEEATGQTCIVVVQINIEGKPPVQIGTIVDAVQEVVYVTSEMLSDAPPYGAETNNFLTGIARVHDRSTNILDIDSILAPDELDALDF